jgi:hypothetical protein
MNKFLIVAGVFVALSGLLELSQGKSDWWARCLQGTGIALAGVAFMRQAK